MNYFKELKVWQKAIELVTETNLFTKEFPKDEIFGLTAQIRRFVVSIPSNIAEGCGRKLNKDFSNFLGIALGSFLNLKLKLLFQKTLDFYQRNNLVCSSQKYTISKI